MMLVTYFFLKNEMKKKKDKTVKLDILSSIMHCLGLKFKLIQKLNNRIRSRWQYNSYDVKLS